MPSKKEEQSEYIIAARAIKLMRVSRHAFEKLVKNGVLSQEKKGEKIVYNVNEIVSFMQTVEYKNMVEGTIDKRNTLNDLTGKEWLPETKSYFYQKGLGADHEDAQIERQHPAPYSFQDIEKLISFFTKKGMFVLDPFGGVGSTTRFAHIMKMFQMT